MVLAGDEGQAIYQAGMSFQKLGVDVAGRSTSLKTNHRNTREIMHLAETYRALWHGEAPPDPGEIADAFREGPSPELWRHADTEEAEAGLVKRVAFFISVLGYDPENIAVLTAFKDDVERVKAVLAEAGHRTVDVRTKNFDFESSRGVRVSTLHSAKGVEFPVVMLYLLWLPSPGGLSEEMATERGFNLIYVAITRAMDNLQVFLPAELDTAPIRTLADAHEKLLELERRADEAMVESGFADAG
jgi:superfamily I DNA/RNA helicase